MKIVLIAAALLITLLTSGPAWARLHGEIVEFGETTSEPESSSPPSPPDTETISPVIHVKNLRFVSHADRLVAERCLGFGVRLRLTSDSGEKLPQRIIVLVHHPRITRPDHASATDESYSTRVDVDLVYNGFSFDEAWEMQPGDWTFRFTYDGELLASKTFSIAAPTSAGSPCNVPTS